MKPWFQQQMLEQTFFNIITIYIEFTKILKIKLIKQDNIGRKTYIRHIPLIENSVRN